MKNEMNAIGLMSGTSADGLGAAYCSVNFEKRKVKQLAFRNYPYGKALREKIMRARSLSVERLSLLNYELGRLWATLLLDFVKKSGIKPGEIDVIGSHGQTVYHNSRLKNTFQIGEASFLSEILKRPVVCDFRHQDLAAGGEGAPLVPYFDEFIFGDSAPAALQNVGGVGNVSIVGEGVKTGGFDTGPGNSLMDWAVHLLTGGRASYDRDGNWASRGKIDFKKAGKFLKAPFFSRKPPKSLDREEFGESFLLKNFDLKKESRFDVLATLNYFTALSIARSLEKHVKERPERLIVSGGGALNKTLLANLTALLPGLKVESIAAYGYDPLAKEAMAFALLAAASLSGLPNNCPGVTGASGFRVMGKIISPFPERTLGA
ncbi:MAG: anhydro-N-acetylmuramic acid kinase [Elusimicrobia bacterium CG08_land_8_20_14_0_20_51_18]|nr:MAG: anhydro-N-acetylmuramic acid kinase [Elusimicrobia bacterium CG08_land_8_20_14_0_20_51_18]